MQTSETMHPAQIAAYRRMSGEQKYRLAMSFYFTARRIKTASLAQKHPHWSGEELKKAVNRALHYENLDPLSEVCIGCMIACSFASIQHR